MNRYITYILYSRVLDKFYIGFTEGDMQVRLAKHLSSHSGFTSRAKDWQLVYTEIFATKKEAMQREKEIKGWKSKLRIEQLINRPNN